MNGACLRERAELFTDLAELLDSSYVGTIQDLNFLQAMLSMRKHIKAESQDAEWPIELAAIYSTAGAGEGLNVERLEDIRRFMITLRTLDDEDFAKMVIEPIQGATS